MFRPWGGFTAAGAVRQECGRGSSRGFRISPLERGGPAQPGRGVYLETGLVDCWSIGVVCPKFQVVKSV
jgi:hypothetical protein